MKDYIKSLFPCRWIFILVMFLSIEYLLLFLPHFLISSIINLFTWFVVDVTIGLGRREERWWLNIIGVFYLMILAGLLLWLAETLKH